MKPTVVLQTDFGNGGGGVMAGVIKSVDPASFTFAMSATEVHGEGFKQE